MRVDKVKVGLVGLGMVCDSHLKAYASHPDAAVIAVCDLDEARARTVAREFGVPKYFTSIDEMLRDDDINTVDITTPTALHAPMALAAAKAQKNILCEKPFCLTLEEGSAVCDEADKQGVTLMVGESYIFMSSITKARELISAGEIGKPTQMRQRFGAWVQRAGAIDEDREITELHRGWRMNPKIGEGFPWMFDHCVHFFATARYLMNDAGIKQVHSLRSDISWLNVAAFSASDKAEMNIYRPEAANDIPIMTWSYEDPACQGVWMRAEALNGKYDPMFGFSATVIGDKGMIEVLGEGGKGLQWQGRDVHLILHRKGLETRTFRFDEGGDDIWQSEVSYYSQAHINQIHEFVEALRQGTGTRYSGREGLREIRTTMAAICSAKEGRVVDVDEVTDSRFRG